jgi:hypothetical protein
MGEVIRRQSSVDDIMADVTTTLDRAVARGGEWRELAEQRLGPVITLFNGVEVQLVAARATAAPLAAAVAAENERADDALGKVSDDVWNAVGRPASDPALAILFPGGISYYAEGDTQGQPDRMDVLAQLLTSRIHPKLAAEKAQAAAAEVTEAANSLRAAVDAHRAPAARLGALERVRTAVARSGQLELSHLKRLYRAASFSESDIHAVIPDRSKPKKAGPKPA